MRRGCKDEEIWIGKKPTNFLFEIQNNPKIYLQKKLNFFEIKLLQTGSGDHQRPVGADGLEVERVSAVSEIRVGGRHLVPAAAVSQDGRVAVPAALVFLVALERFREVLIEVDEIAVLERRWPTWRFRVFVSRWLHSCGSASRLYAPTT